MQGIGASWEFSTDNFPYMFGARAMDLEISDSNLRKVILATYERASSCRNAGLESLFMRERARGERERVHITLGYNIAFKRD